MINSTAATNLPENTVLNANSVLSQKISVELAHESDSFPMLNSFGEFVFDANASISLSQEEKNLMQSRAEQKFEELFDIFRINRNDTNSQNTPRRLAKMWIQELFRGRYEAPPEITVFPNRNNVDELVISKGITVMSVCSHHWQPISGNCAIGYIPGEYIIGLSKLTRIVDWFARRGQIQEELGEQIADYLVKLIKPKALGVVISCKHYCMIARGVSTNDTNSLMVTSVMRGYLANNMNLRNEFLKLIA